MDRTWPMESARQLASDRAGRVTTVRSSSAPSVPENQATPCMQPVSAPATPAPSRRTAAPGEAAAKSSFSRPGSPARVPSTTLTLRSPRRGGRADRAVPRTAAHRSPGRTRRRPAWKSLPSQLPPQCVQVRGEQLDDTERALRVDTCDGEQEPLPSGRAACRGNRRRTAKQDRCPDRTCAQPPSADPPPSRARLPHVPSAARDLGRRCPTCPGTYAVRRRRPGRHG